MFDYFGFQKGVHKKKNQEGFFALLLISDLKGIFFFQDLKTWFNRFFFIFKNQYFSTGGGTKRYSLGNFLLGCLGSFLEIGTKLGRRLKFIGIDFGWFFFNSSCSLIGGNRKHFGLRIEKRVLRGVLSLISEFLSFLLSEIFRGLFLVKKKNPVIFVKKLGWIFCRRFIYGLARRFYLKKINFLLQEKNFGHKGAKKKKKKTNFFFIKSLGYFEQRFWGLKKGR